MIEGTAHVFTERATAGSNSRRNKLKRGQEIRVGSNSKMEIDFPMELL
jgi:hypothetical protein